MRWARCSALGDTAPPAGECVATARGDPTRPARRCNECGAGLTSHVVVRRIGALGAGCANTSALAAAWHLLEPCAPWWSAPGTDPITTAPGAALRTHFALRYGAARSGDEAQSVREDAVRSAFKSPFYPFVLATTSVGQEGLDFHPWCHSVWHWNLPGNPVDLEQREGRVHRYKGHAVRKNVAEQHGSRLLAQWKGGSDPWRALFDIAERSRAASDSELIPCWLAPGSHQVERVVPVLPLSREEGQLVRLKHNLALYRVAFGQPRQAELIELLLAADVPVEELERWVVRLEPGRV